MKTIEFIFILLAATAYSINTYATLGGRNIFSSEAESAEVTQGCLELQALGNVHELTSRIDANTDKILKIMKDDDPTEDTPEVHRLSEMIKADGDVLVSILDSQFTKQKYIQNLVWRLEDRRLDISQITKTYAFEGINFKGQAPELTQQLSFEIKGDTVFAHLIRPASLVEICQLQPAMRITSRVEFYYKSNPKKSRSLRFRLLGFKIPSPSSQPPKNKSNRAPEPL